MDSKTDSTASLRILPEPAPRFRFPCCPFMLSILLSKARFRHSIAQRADSRRCQPEPVHPCINPDHFRQGPLDTIGGLLRLNQTRGDVSDERPRRSLREDLKAAPVRLGNHIHQYVKAIYNDTNAKLCHVSASSSLQNIPRRALWSADYQ